MSGPLENIRRGWISRLAYYSFLLLVVSLGLPQLPIHLFGLDVLVTDLLFLLAGTLCAISILLRQQRIVWLRFYWALGAYLGAMFISAWFSVDRTSSLTRFPEEGYLLCLAVLSVNIIGSRPALKKAIFAWLIGTLISIFIGLGTIGLFYTVPTSWLLEYLTYHYGSVPIGNYPRITAGFVSASMFCNYLNVSMVLALFAAAERWLSLKLSIVFVLSIVVAAVFTVSIGLGGIALAIALFTWFFLEVQWSTRRTVLVLGCLASLAFLFISFFALSPYPGAHILWTVPILGLDIMPSARMMVWSDVVKTFLARPVTGVGLGEPVANVVFMNTEGNSSLLTDAHNSFLSVASQNGIFGLSAFAYLVYVIVRRWTVRLRDQIPAPTVTALGIAFVCSFIYQGLTGSYEDSRHLWVLIGMFLAADRIERLEA